MASYVSSQTLRQVPVMLPGWSRVAVPGHFTLLASADRVCVVRDLLYKPQLVWFEHACNFA